MICPQCGARSSSVLETRMAGETIRRRRVCSPHKHRFWTLEVTSAAAKGADAALVYRYELRNAAGLAKDLADMLGGLAGS